MEYPEEIYATRDSGLLTGKQLKYAGAGWGRRLAFDVGYDVGYVAGRNEQSDYIESMSSLESVLTDVEKLEGEDLPFVKRLIERTVRAVRAEQADPLAGYSNLTAAISAGEPIDWEKLDGLNVKCVNPELGTLARWLERDKNYTADSFIGWYKPAAGQIWEAALDGAWHGDNGWTLWLEGEIPLRRKTADQLDEARCFKGERDGEVRDFIVYLPRFNDKTKFVTSTALHASESKSGATRDSVAYLAHEVDVIEEYGIGTFQKPEGK